MPGIDIDIEATPRSAETAVNAALDRLKQSAEASASTLSKIFSLQSLDRVVSKFGDVKDIVGKVGTSLLGMSEESTRAAEATLELSSKGASLGSVLGPLGSAIGGIIGGLIGWYNAAEETRKKEEELTKTIEEAARVRQAIAERELKYSKRSADETNENIDQLYDNLQDIYGKIETQSTKVKGAALRALTVTGDDIAQSQMSFKDAQKKLEEFLAKPVIFDKTKDIKEQEKALKDQEDALREAVKDAEYSFGQLQKEANKGFEAASKILQDAEKNAGKLTVTTKTAVKVVKELVDLNEHLALAAARRENLPSTRDRRAQDPASKADTAAFDEEISSTINANTEALQRFNEVAQDMAPPFYEATDAAESFAQKLGRLVGLGADLTSTFEMVGSSMRQSFIDSGVHTAKLFFDQVQAGQVSLKGLAGAFLGELAEFGKQKGAEIFIQGLVDEAQGIGLLIRSAGLDPRGHMLVAHGAAEMALGLALGSGGAAAGSIGGRLSGNSSAGDSSSVPGNGANGFGGGGTTGGTRVNGVDNGPIQQTPSVVIVYQSAIPPGQREAEAHGRVVAGLLGAAIQGGSSADIDDGTGASDILRKLKGDR